MNRSGNDRAGSGVKRELRIGAESEAHRAYLAGLKRQKRRVTALRLAILIGFILVWEAAARLGLINDFIFSSPSRVAATVGTVSAANEMTTSPSLSVGAPRDEVAAPAVLP